MVIGAFFFAIGSVGLALLILSAFNRATYRRGRRAMARELASFLDDRDRLVGSAARETGLAESLISVEKRIAHAEELRALSAHREADTFAGIGRGGAGGADLSEQASAPKASQETQVRDNMREP